MELKDTENRIEKAFHEQTIYVGDKIGRVEKAFQDQTTFFNAKFDAQNRWLFGLFITLIVAVFALVGSIITAVFTAI